MKKIIALIGLAFFIASCVPIKRLTYLQEGEAKPDYQLQRSSYLLQPNDILSITIRSYDSETSQYFRMQQVHRVRPGSNMICTRNKQVFVSRIFPCTSICNPTTKNNG